MRRNGFVQSDGLSMSYNDIIGGNSAIKDKSHVFSSSPGSGATGVLGARADTILDVGGG